MLHSESSIGGKKKKAKLIASSAAMSIGGTSLHFKEIFIYAIFKATKTRPFKAVTGKMEPEVTGCFLKKPSPGR